MKCSRCRSENRDAARLGWASRLGGMGMHFWSARAAEERMESGALFVVARGNLDLYEYLKQEFAGEPVTVILDRREGERRSNDEGPLGEERRRHARRRHPEADEALRARGFVVLPEAASCAD